jgi:hypothetical protein
MPTAVHANTTRLYRLQVVANPLLNVETCPVARAFQQSLQDLNAGARKHAHPVRPS